MNIVLIGYRCSGKSTVGTLLSERLGRPLADTDRLVESRLDRSIRDFIAEKGWEAFRNVERQTVRELMSKRNLVIATGGGVVMDLENVAQLKQNGWLIWLKADGEEIRRRMLKDAKTEHSRPALSGVDPFSEIDKVLQSRAKAYERVSDFVLDTTHRSPGLVVEEILRSLPWTPSRGQALSALQAC